MKTSRKSVAATVVALALLGAASAGSYALWSDSKSLPTTITVSTGKLAATVGTGAVYEMQKRGGTADSPTWAVSDAAITLDANYKASPGDKFRILVPVKVELTGNNIAATFDAPIPATGVGVTDGQLVVSGIKVTPVSLMTANGTTNAVVPADWTAAKTLAVPASPWTNVMKKNLVTSGNADLVNYYILVYEVEFPSTETANQSVASTTIGNLLRGGNVTLTQTH